MDYQTTINCLTLASSAKSQLLRLGLPPRQLEHLIHLLDQIRLRLIHSALHAPELDQQARLQLQSLSRDLERCLNPDYGQSLA